MKDKQFVEEIRARTGEPVKYIWGTVNTVYSISQHTCYSIDFLQNEIINLLDNRICTSSKAAAKLFTD